MDSAPRVDDDTPKGFDWRRIEGVLSLRAYRSWIAAGGRLALAPCAAAVFILTPMASFGSGTRP